MRRGLSGLIVGATLVFAASSALGAYSQPASTFSSGGGESSSANYVNLGIMGQGMPVGASASAGYQNDAGFIPVLGGWKILYPIVAVNPTTLLFELALAGNSTQSITVGNQGGGTLQWSASKANNASWLTVTPTGGQTLGIMADATGLTPGSTYHETVNITGVGAPNTATVVVTLTVSSSYLLTVQISTGQAFGTGTVNSNPSGLITCPGDCTELLPAGSAVALMATGSNSTLGSWGNACTGSGSCSVTMDGNKTVVVNFTPDPAAVLVSGDLTRYYLIDPALDAIGSLGKIVSARELVLVEAVTMSTPYTILLKGGYTDNAFTTRTTTSSTVIDGSLKIRSGTLKVDRLKIR